MSMPLGQMPGVEDYLPKLSAAPSQRWKCLACICQVLDIRNKVKTGKLPEDTLEPLIQDACTMAPTWQSQAMMGALIYQCVVVPTCMDHLDAQEKSPEARAVEGGIMLGRPGEM